jgi:hypothetical protein
MENVQLIVWTVLLRPFVVSVQDEYDLSFKFMCIKTTTDFKYFGYFYYTERCSGLHI